jgi:hypothetical protein
MAKKLEDFDFEDRGGGAAQKYAWDAWLDGSTWEIRQGEDYEISTENMRVNLHAKAKQKKMEVRTRKVPRPGNPEHGQWEGLVFQFVAASPSIAG